MAHDDHKTHHHILHNGVIIKVGAALLVLTLLTVWVAGFDLGKLNFIVAMAIATLKGTLVALFFMNLLYDRRENGLIFVTSFVFLAVFIVLTSVDLFFRGNVYTPVMGGPPFEIAASGGPSKFKDPWIATPELLAHGKEFFQQNCVTCHGPEGHGDGPAGASLNPHPRNFTSDQGWTNPRNLAGVFKTLRDGVPGTGMASWTTFPSDDRWAVAHYVLSLGPKPVAATPADFAKFNIALTNGAAEPKEKSIPIEVAMERMIVAAAPAPAEAAVPPMAMAHSDSVGARIFRASCESCHGAAGQGAMMEAHGSGPESTLQTLPFGPQTEGLQSEAEFSRLVMRGLPGAMMPALGNLTQAEMGELYQYAKSLKH